MPYTVELAFTRKVLKNMQLNSHIIRNNQITDNIDLGLRAYLGIEQDSRKMISAIHDILEKNTITVITDEFMCNYVLFHLSDTHNSEIFICGPYITEEMTKQKLMQNAEKHNISPHLFAQFSRYYDNLTRISDTSSLIALFTTLGESIWGKKDNFSIKNYTENDGTLTETAKAHSLQKYSLHVQKAMTIVDSDLTADLSLKTVSGILGINESYFSSLFRKETGKTFTHFVNQKRIEQARKLLISTSLQIQTVAQLCGILDVNYFSKLFQKHTGMSPSEFRNSKNKFTAACT